MAEGTGKGGSDQDDEAGRSRAEIEMESAISMSRELGSAAAVRERLVRMQSSAERKRTREDDGQESAGRGACVRSPEVAWFAASIPESLARRMQSPAVLSSSGASARDESASGGRPNGAGSSSRAEIHAIPSSIRRSPAVPVAIAPSVPAAVAASPVPVQPHEQEPPVPMQAQEQEPAILPEEVAPMAGHAAAVPPAGKPFQKKRKRLARARVDRHLDLKPVSDRTRFFRVADKIKSVQGGDHESDCCCLGSHISEASRPFSTPPPITWTRTCRNLQGRRRIESVN